MGDQFRKIAAMRMPDVVPGGAAMAEPKFERASPEDLLVDETYQRNLSERSVRLIRKIVANWDWRTFMPPVVVRTKDGLHVIDGQHTAIAAATHPKITTIPIMLVTADLVADRAKTFLGRNRDRIAVTPNQLHHAAVAAGDDDAVTIDQVCRRAGVRILRYPVGVHECKSGDTMAIGAIAALVAKRQPLRARQVLSVTTDAKLAPVSASAIKAIDELLHGDEHKGKYDAGDLATALRGQMGALEAQAKRAAARDGVPLWRALVPILARSTLRVAA